MQKELTRRELNILVNVLNMVLDYIKKPENNKDITFKFAYTLTKNKQLLEPEIKTTNESIEISGLQEDINKLTEYDQKRIDLNLDYCNRESNGQPSVQFNPITNEQFYVIPKEKRKEFEKKLKNLQQEYKEVLDKKEEVDKKFNEIMNEKVKVNIFQVSIDQVPNNPFITSVVEQLSILIEE